MNTKITISTASQKLNLSPHSVKRWINQGKLNGEKLNGKWYVIDDELFSQHLYINGTHLHTNNEHHLSTNGVHLHTEIEHLKSIICEKDKQLADKDARFEDFREQLSRRDEQIDHFQQIVAMSQKNIGALTEQLSDSRQLIEDMRQRKTVWQRLKAVFVTSTG